MKILIYKRYERPAHEGVELEEEASGIQISGVTRGTRYEDGGGVEMEAEDGWHRGRRNLNSQQQARSLRPLFNLFLKES